MLKQGLYKLYWEYILPNREDEVRISSIGGLTMAQSARKLRSSATAWTCQPEDTSLPAHVYNRLHSDECPFWMIRARILESQRGTHFGRTKPET